MGRVSIAGQGVVIFEGASLLITGALVRLAQARNQVGRAPAGLPEAQAPLAAHGDGATSPVIALVLRD